MSADATFLETLFRLDNKLQSIRVQAKALGFSDSRFDMIFRHVNEEAEVSVAWGSADERLDELKRRVLMQA